jgi:hypothetical protein
MISSDDKILECSVNVLLSEKASTIRKFDDDENKIIIYKYRDENISGGDSVIIQLNLFDKVVATSDIEDVYPNIGLDFLWEFCKKPVDSVRAHFTKDGNIKIHNGVVVLSPIQKLYTESDLYNILEYALGSHDKDRIKDIISTYRKK